MRLITFFSLLIAGIIFTGAKFAEPWNQSLKPEKLNGTWLPVKQEIGGKPLPAAAFETQKLIINDSTYIVVAESVDKGVIRYSENKMDIFGKDGVNAGKHFTAIYKYENEQLTICYNLSGNAYPEAFETKSKPYLFISVFKKSQELSFLRL
jgi:uncharacterized protein (TIGR03067 family)